MYSDQIRVQRREGLQRAIVECQIFVQRPKRGDRWRNRRGLDAVGRHRRLRVQKRFNRFFI